MYDFVATKVNPVCGQFSPTKKTYNPAISFDVNWLRIYKWVVMPVFKWRLLQPSITESTCTLISTTVWQFMDWNPGFMLYSDGNCAQHLLNK